MLVVRVISRTEVSRRSKQIEVPEELMLADKREASGKQGKMRQNSKKAGAEDSAAYLEFL